MGDPDGIQLHEESGLIDADDDPSYQPRNASTNFSCVCHALTIPFSLHSFLLVIQFFSRQPHKLELKYTTRSMSGFKVTWSWRNTITETFKILEGSSRINTLYCMNENSERKLMHYQYMHSVV